MLAVAKSKKRWVPPPDNRVNIRGFYLFQEFIERWGGRDPGRYSEITEWFRGRNDAPGKPSGAQVWLWLCKHCGHDPKPYDFIPAGHPLKLTIEHSLLWNDSNWSRRRRNWKPNCVNTCRG